MKPGSEIPGIPAQVTRATDLPSSKQLDDPRGRLPLVVLVEGDLRLADLEVLEQHAGVAGVLAGDEVHLLAESPAPAA